MGKSQKDMCPFSYWSVLNDMKVRRQKDICLGERQKHMCPFSYWGAREGNSEPTGKFYATIPESPMQEGHKYGKKPKGHVSF